MRVVGIDTHKATLAACAIDEIGGVLDERTFPNDPAGFAALLEWVVGVDAGRIGLEGSAGYGAGAARFLVAAGCTAVEVPPQLSHRERIRTRRAGKSDPGDALAIARVTLREAELPPVRLADASRELGLLVEAREDLVAEATRVRNRLHADLVVIVPGYSAAAANLVSAKCRRTAGRLLRGIAGVQAELARNRLGRLAKLASEIDELERRIAELVAEVGDVRRFRSADAFAMLAGVAPIPASSGQTSRMRLNRGGNRQLNRALYAIAFAQVRWHEPAQAFVARKRAEGKSWREAIRALKRHLARVVFRLLSAAAQPSVLGA
jgi:transposase